MRLRQILLNLLSNACKFTKEGEVRLKARKVCDGRDWIDLAVCDTGIGHDGGAAREIVRGIHPGRFAHRAALRRHGHGPCHHPKLARMMGGDVTVTSEPGKGSVFTVRLPGSASS
jgi:signal transduction histidine kinase